MGENCCGPPAETKFGSTSTLIARVPSTASEAEAALSWKVCSWWRRPPNTRHSPITQLSTIISAEKTVSRATDSLPSEPASMMETISPTSRIVTHTARMIEPIGSPTLSARISAWCTDAKIDAPRAIDARMITGIASSETSPRYFSATSTSAAAGAAQVQSGIVVW